MHVASQGLGRREFLKLSALAAGGGLATSVLGSYVETVGILVRGTGTPLNQHSQANTMAMTTPIDSSVDILDPLSIPKFENQLTAPPPVFQPNVVTSHGTVIRYEYNVGSLVKASTAGPP